MTLSECYEEMGADLHEVLRRLKTEERIGEIWRERPALSCEPVMELDVKWAGESRKDKIAGIREQMKAKKANIFILASLADIAWLLNIRGNDIHSCPYRKRHLQKARSVLQHLSRFSCS